MFDLAFINTTLKPFLKINFTLNGNIICSSYFLWHNILQEKQTTISVKKAILEWHIRDYNIEENELT